MVEKFKNLLESITATKGPVDVFAVLKMDELVDKWSVVLSAPWIGNGGEGTLEDFKFIWSLIRSTFSSEEKSEIARVGMFPKENHLVKELLKLPVDYRFENQESVNGSIVYDGYILSSSQK